MADIRIVPGSSIMSFTSSLNFIEKITQDASGSLNLYGSGSTGRTELLSVDGNNGRLFTVSDDLSDSLFSVNTIAGLPVIEAFADNTVKIGKYGQENIVVSGSNTAISGSLILSSTGVANSPSLRINTSTSATFIHTQENFASNMTSGQHAMIWFGHDGSTKNAGGIGYYWSGGGSNSNFITLGHWGNDDIFRIYGDGTVSVGTNTILHAGNYTSYAPTLTGGGASGTWGISISGNAATATTATNSSQLGSIDSSRFVFGDGANGRSTDKSYGNANTSDSSNSSGFYFGAAVTGMPGTDWWNWLTVAGNSWSGADGYRWQMAGSFWSDDWRLRRQTSGGWNSWVSILHSGNYTSYAPSLTGTGASGTWGINITGYSTSFPTAYIGGSQTNPQTYFNYGIGLKVAMTKTDLGDWSDTLWINGYSGADVPNMCALHFLRNGTPRMWISSQHSSATSYGTHYEVLTDYNYSSRQYFYDGLSIGTAGVRTGNLANVNSLAIGDTDTGFRQNGDGVLETWCNNVLVRQDTYPTGTILYRGLDSTYGIGRSSGALNTLGGNIGATTPSWNNNQLEIKCNDAGTVAIALHRSGYTSDTISVTDTSGIRLNGNIALHAGNYNSYATPTSRTLTINGTAYDLSADRSWTVSAAETDTLATVTARGNSSTGDVNINGHTVGRGGGNISTNISVGNVALANNTTGYYNTAIGQSSLYSNTIGYFNTAIGYNALSANTGGVNNTAVGFAALDYITTGSNNTAIGSSAGNLSLGSGNVFIGYNAGPSTNSSADNLLYIANNSGTPLIFGNFGSKFVTINGALQSTGALTVQGSATAAGFFNSSDRRLKSITRRDGDVAYYKWLDGRDNKEHIGYIAQEQQQKYPDQVGTDGEFLTVNYTEILVAKVRELEKEIELLKSK